VVSGSYVVFFILKVSPVGIEVQPGWDGCGNELWTGCGGCNMVGAFDQPQIQLSFCIELENICTLSVPRDLRIACKMVSSKLLSIHVETGEGSRVKAAQRQMGRWEVGVGGRGGGVSYPATHRKSHVLCVVAGPVFGRRGILVGRQGERGVASHGTDRSTGDH